MKTKRLVRYLVTSLVISLLTMLAVRVQNNQANAVLALNKIRDKIVAMAQNTKANEGGDVIFGGAGSEAGQFLELRDITFDATGALYALDGQRLFKQNRVGNLRVQKFDTNGKLLQTFDLRDAATGQNLGDKNDPQRVAADAAGNVYVSQPVAGLVQQFGPNGQWLRNYTVPGAFAIATAPMEGGERIVVVPSRRPAINGDKIVVLSPAGGIEKTIALPEPYRDVKDVTVDKNGNFYVKAEPNAIYELSPDGKLLKTFGGNPTAHNADGSGLLHTVAVDSKGNVYSMTRGNPGNVARFDADGKTVTQRGGQFKWAAPWSIHSGYVALAVDPDDRLWVAAPNPRALDDPRYKTDPILPAILRTKTDFFQTPASAITQRPVYQLGFKAELNSDLPYNIAYEPKTAIPMHFSVPVSNRHVESVSVRWRAFDVFKNEVAKGQLALPLENGKAAQADFSFVPPRYGAYWVTAEISSPQGPLGSIGENIGVTPRFTNMPVLTDGQRTGDWADIASQAWAGLSAVRLQPNFKRPEKLDPLVALGKQFGSNTNIFIQITASPKEVTPEMVRALAERFKGQGMVYEVANEPNFSMGVNQYFELHKMVYENIKAVDPQARVMGPATVNIDLEWARRLYELGFKNVSDIISFHDYEGNESIAPEHWRYKYDELRKIMAQNGDADKPIWQTERAIVGIRGPNLQSLVQAIRLTMHTDLLETLGIPNEHNMYYYLNQGGYSTVPSYIWSTAGPMPAALASRTRQALTGALGRKYAGSLDFGKDGNDLFLGVRYAGTDGETVSLRNLGTRPTPLDFGVQGATTLNITDAWGNESTVPVQAGKARLTLEQLPIYIRLPKGGSLTAPKLNFGNDLATQGTFSYSGTTKSDFTLLNNGLVENFHTGDPNGATNGSKIWIGDLPDNEGKITPQTLELSFATPETISKILLRGVRADNAFCALLDYDLQYLDGQTWKTIESVHNPMPPSEEVTTGDATRAIWMDDTNFYLHQFPAITTSKLRLVVRDVTRGFVPDEPVPVSGKTIAPKLMLSEVKVF